MSVGTAPCVPFTRVASSGMKSMKMRNHVYGLTGGYGYVGSMDGAGIGLRQVSEDTPHILPLPIMMGAFEELAARPEEEIEEALRHHIQVLRIDKPTL